MARYTGWVAQEENVLALPESLKSASAVASVTAIEDVPAGVPSEVRRRRPDILQAEHPLKSANADIDAVGVAFFPGITPTGLAGAQQDQVTLRLACQSKFLTLHKSFGGGWQPEAGKGKAPAR